MTERIAVVGAGTVGAHLASAFVAAGHEVRMGVRDPAGETVTDVGRRLGIDVVSIDRAADGADLIVLAVPHAAVEEAVRAVAPPADAIVIDATNPVGRVLPDGADSTLDVVAATGVASPLVKAFNTIGAEAFVSPEIDGSPLFLPVAGDSPAAERVADLARSIGFDALVVGGRAEARLNENVAEFWIHLAFRVGLGRDFGFARLRR
ncbi:MAG: NAD(P)-binding domain-containing protein [Actinomycetota bacterium]